MSITWNRKLLVSVYTAQEAREAILGGGRIIDSEDPRTALGNISPLRIMDVADAALEFKRGHDVQLSTNIGEDQLLFRRADTGDAIEKSPDEIAGKAAQAAIGVAASMGTDVHPVALLKVGLDGMGVDMLGKTLKEVVLTLRRTVHHRQTQVMSVLFAQDMAEWQARKALFHKELLKARQFEPAPKGGDGAFSLLAGDVAVNTLKKRDGRILFTDASQVNLQAIIDEGILPKGSDGFVRITDLFDHEKFFPQQASGGRTNQAIIKVMVEATAAAGAQAIMLDTSILCKTANICLIDTSSPVGAGDGAPRMVDMNRHFKTNGVPRKGILSLDDIRFFVDYAHFHGLVVNLAGSVNSYQAQMLWVLVPQLDQLSTRGAASRKRLDPSDPGAGVAVDTREDREIDRHLVRGMAPPEHGGVLSLPRSLQESPEAMQDVKAMTALIEREREKLGMPALVVEWV